MRIGLISDTHGQMHPALPELFRGVEAILHAGDVGSQAVLDLLRALAPVHAVQGNTDPSGLDLPPLRVVQFPFGRVVVTHSHLLRPDAADPGEIADHFAPQQPKVIVFGHTHQAVAEWHGATLVVNPGAACKPRFRDRPSVAVLTWDAGRERLECEHCPLDWRLA